MADSPASQYARERTHALSLLARRVVYYAYCVMHKIFESEEPRMNTQEFQRMLTEKYGL